MKKFLTISLMAVLLLSSCVEENVIERSDDHAIVFENTFVDKATRADITTENIDEFSVYGYKNNRYGILWSNERVYKRGSSNDAAGQSYAVPTDEGGAYPSPTGWTYDNLAYWEEGNTYYFHGIAPYNGNYVHKPWTFEADQSDPSKGTISVDDTSFDLVYAYHEREVKEGSLGMYQYNQPAPISFTFQHLFARVRIRIVNELSNKNSRIHVSNLMTYPLITQASARVPFTETVQWTLGEGKGAVGFIEEGEEVIIYHKELGINDENVGEYITNEFYVIPQTIKELAYLFHFSAQQYSCLEPGKTNGIGALMADDFTFEAGKSYQFTVRLTDRNFYEVFHLIQFDDITVSDWEDWEESEIWYY